MKINLTQRIQLFTLGGCTLFIAIVISILFAAQSLELAFERQDYAQKIDNQTNILKQFVLTSSLYPQSKLNNNRINTQRNLAKLLQQPPKLPPQQQTIQNSLKSQNSSIQKLYKQVGNLHFNQTSKVIRNHLNARLGAQLETISDDSKQLLAMAQADIHSTMYQQGVIIVLVLITAICVMLVSSYNLIHIFKTSLQEIKHAIEKNTYDDFQEIELSQKSQEFDDIVQKFNYMNKKLSETTVSLDVMKQVVEERTHFLEKLSNTDPLTQVANRRALFERGEMEFSRVLRTKNKLTLILLDCDLFKSFNDQFGHQFGDELLIHICKICNQEIRDIDFLARYGGEEFIIILPDCDEHGGVEIAKRIQDSLASHCVAIKDKEVCMTLSMGISMLSDKHKNFVQLINDADKAMYRAKKNGRNRIEVMQDSQLH